MEEEPVLWGSAVPRRETEAIESVIPDASPHRATVPHEVSNDFTAQPQPSKIATVDDHHQPPKEAAVVGSSLTVEYSTSMTVISQGGTGITAVQGRHALTSSAGVNADPNADTTHPASAYRTRTARAKSVMVDWLQKELDLLQTTLHLTPTSVFELLDRARKWDRNQACDGVDEVNSATATAAELSAQFTSVEGATLIKVMGYTKRNNPSGAQGQEQAEPLEQRAGELRAKKGIACTPAGASNGTNSAGGLGRIVAQCLLGGATVLDQCFPNPQVAVAVVAANREKKKRPVESVGHPTTGGGEAVGSLRNFDKKVQALMQASEELQLEMQTQQPQLRKEMEAMLLLVERMENPSPVGAPNTEPESELGAASSHTAKERLQPLLETIDNCFVLCKHVLAVLRCVLLLCKGLPLPAGENPLPSQTARTNRKRARDGREEVGAVEDEAREHSLVQPMPNRADIGSSTSVQTTETETAKSAGNPNPQVQIRSTALPIKEGNSEVDSNSSDESTSDFDVSSIGPNSGTSPNATIVRFPLNRMQRQCYREFELSLHRVMMSLQAVTQLQSYPLGPSQSQTGQLMSRSASSYSQLESSRLSQLAPDSFTLAPMFSPWVGVPCHQAAATCPALVSAQRRYLKKLQSIANILMAIDLSGFRAPPPAAPSIGIPAAAAKDGKRSRLQDGRRVVVKPSNGTQQPGQRTALVVPLSVCDETRQLNLRPAGPPPLSQTPFVESVGTMVKVSPTGLVAPTRALGFSQNSQSQSIGFLQTSPPMSQGPPPMPGSGSFDFLSAPIPQPPPPVVSRRNQKLLTHLHLQRKSDNTDVTGFLARRTSDIRHSNVEDDDGRLDSEGDDTMSMMDSASGTAGPRSRNLSPTMPLCPPFFPQGSDSMSILSLDGGSRLVGGGGPSVGAGPAATGNGLQAPSSQPTSSQLQQQLGKSQPKTVQHREIPSWMQSKRKIVAPNSILAAAKQHRSAPATGAAGSPRTKHHGLHRSSEFGLFSPNRRSTVGLLVKPTPERAGSGAGEPKRVGRLHEDPDAPGWMTGAPSGSLLMGLDSGPTERSLLFDDDPLHSSPLLGNRPTGRNNFSEEGPNSSMIGVVDNRRMAASPGKPRAASRKRDADPSEERLQSDPPHAALTAERPGVGVSTPLRNPARPGQFAKEPKSLLFIPPTP